MTLPRLLQQSSISWAPGFEVGSLLCSAVGSFALKAAAGAGGLNARPARGHPCVLVRLSLSLSLSVSVSLCLLLRQAQARRYYYYYCYYYDHSTYRY